MMILQRLVSVSLGLLIAIALTIGLFLLLRKLALWYWKIDERVKLLEDIHQELVKLNNKQ